MGNAEHAQDVETRSSIENPDNPITYSRLIEVIGLSSLSEAGVNVTVDNAMGVPAVWSAVNFISGTMAGLPLKSYRKAKGERKPLNTRISRLLQYNVNEEMSSFAWRKWVFERVLTRGRSYTLIVRGEREPIRYLWPLNNEHVVLKRDAQGRKIYTVTEKLHQGEYRAADIIDVSYALKEDGISHYGPIATNKDTLGLAIAATAYGSRFFDNGGVPPFVISGNFQSEGALKRASDQLEQAIKKSAKERRIALSLPENHELKTIGVDPEKTQLVELKRLLIEDIARIYQLPPNFIQDLTYGTYSNTEQQDIHFVKHTIKRWVEQFEQELNLKLFGWDRQDRYVEFSLDGLLRGDFKTRMEGNAQAIQTAQRTPNELREKDNLPPLPGGDSLFIQGATVPLGSQPQGESDGN